MALAAVIRGNKFNKQITAERVKAIQVPMLAVVGEIDPIKAAVDAMKNVATGLEVVVLPGKDHLTAVADPQLAVTMHEFLLKH
jgi:hypothetical protein